MFYVQNWDALFPQSSAFEILRGQLSSAEKSLQYYDSSKDIKKDSYLLTELSKIQKLVYLVEDRLKILANTPNEPSVLDFLVNGKVSQIPTLKKGLGIFGELRKLVDSKVGQVNDQYDALASEVKDSQFKSLLNNVKQFSKEESNQYGSCCGVMALRVVDFFSKYIDSSQLIDFKSLKDLQMLQTNNVEILEKFEKGSSSLQAEVKKDLRKGQHKLYYCILDNALFKEVGGWQHPHYQGHSFVIEKTKDDKFRIYQSYSSHYSLKSSLVKELSEHPDGLRSHHELFVFLKGLQQLENAKIWDAEVNETYKKCFAVDHETFLGESLKKDSLSVRYKSLVVEEEILKASEGSLLETFNPAESLASRIKVLKDELSPYAINVGAGVVSGTAIAVVALSCMYGVGEAFSRLGII
ncbi:MAG: hypothetical protein S4CHLAM6_15340 [Chlamydiae bacterium]|nr:hypothetical protein [Chlamydiota bacterium]